MALSRPTVSVYDTAGNLIPNTSVTMPSVMQGPVRYDLVSFVHANMLCNSRQAYGVKTNAGYQTSAESWGTGRAVSRIPRVPGGGTHRAGQGAFANFCRGGGMFAPTKTWRRWHRHVNLKQRRHALTSAIAGSAYTSLIMGRGHRISDVQEIPLVVSDDAQNIKKTKDAIKFLKKIGCEEDINKCKESKKIRTGSGKSRNRRYVMRKGPLLVYYEDNGIVAAARNIAGVKTMHVDRLNLLDLAPGGVVGRLIIWTQSAFERLEQLYGDYKAGSVLKSHYIMHRPLMTNADLNRIINSNEVQSYLKEAKEGQHKTPKKRNPLKCRMTRCKLDPLFKRRKNVILSMRKMKTSKPVKQ